MASNRALVLGLLSGFFWGFSFIIPRWLSATPPELISWGRFFVFGIASVIVLINSGLPSRALLKRSWALMALAVLGFSGYYILLTYSIQSTGIFIPTLVIGLLPLTTLLVDRKWNKKQLLPQRLILPLFATLIGIFLISFEGSRGVTTFSWAGSLASLVCLALWTTYAIWNSIEIKKIPSRDTRLWTALLGVCAGVSSTVLTLIINPNIDNYIQYLHAPWFMDWVIGVLVLGLLSSYLAIHFWNLASQNLPAEILGQLIVSETVFGVLFGWIFEWRLPSGIELVAVFLCIAGVLFSIRILQRLSLKKYAK